MDQEIKASQRSCNIKDMYNSWLLDKIQVIHKEVILSFWFLELIRTSFLPSFMQNRARSSIYEFFWWTLRCLSARPRGERDCCLSILHLITPLFSSCCRDGFMVFSNSCLILITWLWIGNPRHPWSPSLPLLLLLFFIESGRILFKETTLQDLAISSEPDDRYLCMDGAWERRKNMVSSWNTLILRKGKGIK